MNAFLEVDNISKSFEDKTILQDVSFKCMAGEINGFTGYNGCGKTVLFKCICGICKVDKGRVDFGGTEHKTNIRPVRDIGVIIERANFLANETGFTNLMYLYRINNKPDKEHIIRIMQLVGLDPRLKTKVKNYSLGMKQRLGIAQAIMENKSFLVLDEPFNGLDKQGVNEIRSLLLQLKKEGKVILLSSHSKEDMDFLCDHVYEIGDGILQMLR